MSNLAPSVTEQDLQNAFQKYVNVADGEGGGCGVGWGVGGMGWFVGD